MQRKTALGSIARIKLRSSARTKLRSIARTKLRSIVPPSFNLYIRHIQTLCAATFIGFKLLTRFGLQRIASEL